MNKLMKQIIKVQLYMNNLKENQRGAISLEYALIAGVIIAIGLAVAASLTSLGEDAESKIPTKL